MRQICDAVGYMHSHNIVHLDLKPENILCKSKGSHLIKIIDFGLTRKLKEGEDVRILFGTPEFVSPEVISYEPVSTTSDMWSVGVVCYVLLSGLSPFMGDNDTETFANISGIAYDFDDEAFDNISEEAKDFITKLLVKHQVSRA
jgi:serine/threonine protein kinase